MRLGNDLNRKRKSPAWQHQAGDCSFGRSISALQQCQLAWPCCQWLALEPVLVLVLEPVLAWLLLVRLSCRQQVHQLFCRRRPMPERQVQEGEVL